LQPGKSDDSAACVYKNAFCRRFTGSGMYSGFLPSVYHANEFGETVKIFIRRKNQRKEK
jgi:hypothetical protein